MKKKVIAAVGLCGLILSSSVSGMDDIASGLYGPKRDITNGMSGMKRDILLRLVKPLDSRKTRAIIGMSQEHYLWKNHYYFINTHLGNCETGAKATREFSDSFNEGLNPATIEPIIKEFENKLKAAMSREFDRRRPLKFSARMIRFIKTLLGLKDPGQRSYPAVPVLTDIAKKIDLDLSPGIPPDRGHGSLRHYRYIEFKHSLLYKIIGKNRFDNATDRVAVKTYTVIELAEAYRLYDTNPDAMDLIPGYTLEMALQELEPHRIEAIFVTPSMRLKFLEIRPLAIRAIKSVDTLTIISELRNTLFNEANVSIEQQHSINASLKWARRAVKNTIQTHNDPEKSVKSEFIIKHYHELLTKTRTELDRELAKPETEQNAELIERLQGDLDWYLSVTSMPIFCE